MNKSEALKELKEALKEEPELLKLSHENPKRNMWVYIVDDILREGFGPNSNEFKLFTEGVPRDELKGSDRQLQKWLDSRLKRRATVIQSIIEKYERQEEEGKHAESGGNKKAELEQFRDDFITYKQLVSAQIKGQLTDQQKTEFQTFRFELQREYGSLKDVIEQYGGPAEIILQGGRAKYEAFSSALFRYTVFSQEALAGVMDTAIGTLNMAIGNLEKPPLPEVGQVRNGEDSAQMANFLFDRMQLHPRVAKASESRFKSGHYSDAIFAAFKAVNNFVKQRTKSTVDGKSLMLEVFSKNNPIIKLNEGRSDSDKDEQEGFMHLFAGAMQGIRNPKAHDEVAELDAHKTLEYLGFASLLMRRAEEGKLKRTRKKQSKPPKY